jgi:hypothetical protein
MVPLEIYENLVFLFLDSTFKVVFCRSLNSRNAGKDNGLNVKAPKFTSLNFFC